MIAGSPVRSGSGLPSTGSRGRYTSVARRTPSRMGTITSVRRTLLKRGEMSLGASTRRMSAALIASSLARSRHQRRSCDDTFTMPPPVGTSARTIPARAASAMG